MGLFTKPQKTDFPDLPDNLYFARLAKIAKKVGKESGKPYISWGFEIVQPPFQKRWVWANTQPTVGPKSQTGKILTVLGVDIETVDMDTFNEQTLVGTYVKVLVETSEDADSGSKFQNVTKVMAVLEAEQPVLQSWLSQMKVTGQVKVAVSPAPVVSQPVSTAPVTSTVAASSVTTPVVTTPAPIVKVDDDFPF